MLPQRVILLRNIFVHFLVFVAAEKFHFSKWINTSGNVALYQFETLLNVGIQDCIDKCKGKKGCKYINYNTQAHTCALVGVKPDNDIPLITEDKKGYVFGNKSEWNMDKYNICADCEDHGVCSKQDPNGELYSHCQDSGCGFPDQLPMTVVYGNMFSIGASVKHECADGYKLIFVKGDNYLVDQELHSPNTHISAVCQENGKWNFTKFRCLPECTTQVYHSGFHNIARGKNVTLSTQFDEFSQAKLMVDGNLNNRWPCASTKHQQNPWILVDLDQSYEVTSIYIVNRMDCCPERLHDLTIAIGDDPLNLVTAKYRQDAVGCDISFKFDSAVKGQFIKLQIEAYEYLTICELEVYAM